MDLLPFASLAAGLLAHLGGALSQTFDALVWDEHRKMTWICTAESGSSKLLAESVGMHLPQAGSLISSVVSALNEPVGFVLSHCLAVARHY
jgi:hypothetical protein